ncbi:MAG: phage major capsid protein [Clostridia bacterium]|nr:phage major capsid protein [Clostridia bacterium]
MVTMTSADKALKSLYLGAVSEQLNTEVNPLLAAIKQTTTDVWGKEVRRVVKYGINGGVGAGDEDGSLPSAGGNNYEQIVTTLKNLYGTIEISDKAIRASQNDAGAFVNLLNAEMEGLIKASTFNFGRMLYGDGSGMLANIVSVADRTVTVDNIKNIAVGMQIEFMTGIGQPSSAGIRKVKTVNAEEKSFTVEGSSLSGAQIGSGYCVVLQGSFNREITGLGAIFGDNSVLYGLSRSSHDWLVPYKIKNAGEISETMIQKAIDHLDDVHGSKVNFIVCSSGVKRAFQKHLSSYKRNLDVMELNGGCKALSYNGIPIVSDRFCPEGTMYLLNTDDFALHQLCDWKWLEGEDGKVLRQTAGKPTYTATLVKYADLVCTRPCGQAMISGITEE